MGFKFNSSITRDLKRLARAYPSMVEASLLKVGKQLAEELEKNTPRDTEGLANNVVYGIDRDNRERVLIGYSKEVAWRAHFVEVGTIKQPPQGFIQRTHDENIQAIIKELEKEIQKGLSRL